MKEIFMCADSNSDWYKRCSEYYDEHNQLREDIEKFFLDRGFEKNSFAYDPSPTLYVLADKYPEYKKYARIEKIIISNKDFYVIKKTAPLHKEFKACNFKMPSKPLIVLELFKSGWEFVCRTTTFILEDKIYVRFDYESGNVTIPEGFTELKMQEFYDIKDKHEAGEIKLKIIR